jgi:hypothetical protein
MLGLTWITNRYTNASAKDAAEFASASHSIRGGLIATGIVSAWTWAGESPSSQALACRRRRFLVPTRTDLALPQLLSSSLRRPPTAVVSLERGGTLPALPYKCCSSHRTPPSSRCTPRTPTLTSRFFERGGPVLRRILPSDSSLWCVAISFRCPCPSIPFFWPFASSLVSSIPSARY